ncbi:MAG: NUDIX domain-containing protein [Lachnospiraceae bacterium]|nr:NUDIX domain-containing protein [Lachnospiraceae bacterium]
MSQGKLRNMASLYLYTDSKMLFLYRIGSRVVADSYTGSAGGHFEKEELNDARACVLRELYEETGLKEDDLENLTLRYITLRLKNQEIRQNYYFFAKIKDMAKEITSNEGKLRWVEKSQAMELDMPFTAEYVIKHYLETGQNTDCLYGGIATEQGVVFEELREF